MKKLISSAIAIVMLVMMLPVPTLAMPDYPTYSSDSVVQTSHGAGCDFYTREYVKSYILSESNYIYGKAFIESTSWYTLSAYCSIDYRVYRGDTGQYMEKLYVLSQKLSMGSKPTQPTTLGKWYNVPTDGTCTVKHCGYTIWLGQHFEQSEGYFIAGEGYAEVMVDLDRELTLLMLLIWPIPLGWF